MKSMRNFFVERMNSIEQKTNTVEDGDGNEHNNAQYAIEGKEILTDGRELINKSSSLTSTEIEKETEREKEKKKSCSNNVDKKSLKKSSPSKSLLLLPQLNLKKSGNQEMSRQDSSSGSPLTAPILKNPKEHRKISLPWFRSSSVSKHLQLARQHTIDTPLSFPFQQKSDLKVGCQEQTWVVSDYTGTPGTNELSVTKGQQVEIIEANTTTESDLVLVRVNCQSDDTVVLEGLVPVSILKPTPVSQATSQKAIKPADNDNSTEQGNNRNKADPLNSAAKRRGFSGRKWLPPQFRKLSQSNKAEKPTDKPLFKKASEKQLRQTTKQEASEEGIECQEARSTNNSNNIKFTSLNTSVNTSQLDYEADEEPGLELPPPMKPMQEPHVIANVPPAFAKVSKESTVSMDNSSKVVDTRTSNDLSEIEQIVKEKTEQHEEKSKFLQPKFEHELNAGERNGYADLGLPYTNTTYQLSDNNEENKTELSSTETGLDKRMSALKELLTTEELYIQDLSHVVNGYIAELSNPKSDIPVPEDLKGKKSSLVFANIEEIYVWHRDHFLKALQRCANAPSELAPTIKRFDSKLRMYTIYLQNKKVADRIVVEHNAYFDQVRQKLKHRFDIGNYLIKPVQRITKYELLLQVIIRESKRDGLVEAIPSLEEAYQIMKNVCSGINDMMILMSLQKFNGMIFAQGKMLKFGVLTCIAEGKIVDRNASSVQKPRELQVFLFDQSIIFADIVGKKTQFSSPNYVYRSHMQMNKIQLEELSNNRFRLISKDPKKPDFSIICFAATADLTREWVEIIRNIIQKQIDFLDALTSPIRYQNEQKTSTTSKK